MKAVHSPNCTAVLPRSSFLAKMATTNSRPTKVAILTAGGLAPCLSSAVGYLIEKVRCMYESLQLPSPQRQYFSLSTNTLFVALHCQNDTLHRLFVFQYNKLDPSIPIICYKNGYKGLLLGDSIEIDVLARKTASVLQAHGGSPI